MAIGKLTTHGVILEKHEMRTVEFFLNRGLDIELIPKSNIFGVHTPDIRMLGLNWEMKSPTGEGRFLIANTLQKAAKQSKHVIVDLRRAKRNQQKCLRELEKEFHLSCSIKHLKIITKEQTLIDYSKAG